MDAESAKVIAGYGGVISTLFLGAKSFLRFAREYRNRHKITGVTIVNGEYKDLMKAIGRIENRQDTQGRSLRHVVERVTRIEERFVRHLDADDGGGEASRPG